LVWWGRRFRLPKVVALVLRPDSGAPCRIADCYSGFSIARVTI
jgi:hypothetical protein